MIVFLQYFMVETPRMRTLTLHFPDDALPTLDTFLKQTKEARVFRRAQAVRDVVQGRRIQNVSDALQLTYAALRKWVHRFAHHGTQGLVDRPRSGRPPKVKGSHQVVRLLHALLSSLAFCQLHFEFEKVPEVLDPIQVDTRSANTIQRAVFAHAPHLTMGKRQRLAQGVRRCGRSDNKEGRLWPSLVGALIEDELPFCWGDHAQFDSATLTDKECVVLRDVAWAVIGQCHNLCRHRFDTCDTRLDFDVASHVICLPPARDERWATRVFPALAFCLGGLSPARRA
jgi:Winged helix-turn helix